VVLYSTNARDYTMVSLIFLALLALAARLRKRRSNHGKTGNLHMSPT